LRTADRATAPSFKTTIAAHNAKKYYHLFLAKSIPGVAAERCSLSGSEITTQDDSEVKNSTDVVVPRPPSGGFLLPVYGVPPLYSASSFLCIRLVARGMSPRSF
jgi:hypothetical protein